MKPAVAVLALVAISVLFVVGCGQAAPVATPTSTPVPAIRVSLLVQVSRDDARWFQGVEVPRGTNAYELTERVTEGNLDATWYPAYRSHFVNALLGVKNTDPRYWLTYLWDESQAKWEPLPVGADLFSLKDGHVLAWAYTDTSEKPSSLPSVVP
ncbi:MAG: hypothetical protein HYY00_06390 [Chloroflexi bacterium]|nr:hypothetical protein [Chloroflexota bacterium]